MANSRSSSSCFGFAAPPTSFSDQVLVPMASSGQFIEISKFMKGSSMPNQEVNVGPGEKLQDDMGAEKSQLVVDVVGLGELDETKSSGCVFVDLRAVGMVVGFTLKRSAVLGVAAWFSLVIDRQSKTASTAFSLLEDGLVSTQPTGNGPRCKMIRSSNLVEPNLVGREIIRSSRKMEDLVLAHKESKSYKLAIVGTRGVGKTTLAQKIYNDQKIKGSFKIQAWICVSQDYNEVTLLKEVLRNIGVHHEQGETIAELQRKLAETIEGKSFFLVLDDVWHSNLPNMKYLRIDGAHAVTKVGPEFFGCKKGDLVCNELVAFPKLECLIFKDMPSWEEWSFFEEEVVAADERGEDGAADTRKEDAPPARLRLLPRLVKLFLQGCPKLRDLPQQLGKDTAC
ncbi:putative disease resistance protein RGA4 [Hordeum vulgare]|nr:putative disease resistance protein RGA4 [Hordeum vulgare]